MTSFLLDTHLLLWAARQPARLSNEARTLIADPANTPVFSVVSIWEVVIKASLGRADFRVDPRRLRHALLGAGYREMHVDGDHALAVARLPLLHRDPFDRLLIAQADVSGILLLTEDPIVARYPGPVRLVA